MNSHRTRAPLPIGAVAVVEREILAAGHAWPLLLSGFIEPLAYFAAFGVGVGHILGSVVDDAGRSLPYIDFVAPALAVTSAINAALFESTYQVSNHLRRSGLFHTMRHTPIESEAFPLGTLLWLCLRCGLGAVAFTVVLLATDHLPGGLMGAAQITVLAMLTAFAVTPLGLLVAVMVREHQDLDVFHALALPLSLLSGAFYPLRLLPKNLRPVAHLLPGGQAVSAARSAAAGAAWLDVLPAAGMLVGCGLALLSLALPAFARYPTWGNRR